MGRRARDARGPFSLVSVVVLLVSVVEVHGATRAGAVVPSSAVGRTVQLDLDPQGDQPNASSGPFAGFDRTGRLAAFLSPATDLVAGDTNGRTDAFVRNLDTNTTQLVTVAPDGSPANDNTVRSRLSRNGSVIVHETYASNLTDNPDTDGLLDIVARDLRTRTNQLVSVTMNGTAARGQEFASGITPDGRYVLFEARTGDLVPGDTNGSIDGFVRDLVTRTTSRVTLGSSFGGDIQPDNHSNPVAISDDGGTVLFTSGASNLGGFSGDLYVRDVRRRTTRDLSRVLPPFQYYQPFLSGTALSADGRFVAFESTDTLDDEEEPTAEGIWLHDRLTRTTRAITAAGDGVWDRALSSLVGMSNDGRRLLFSVGGQAWLYDRVAGTTRALPAGLHPVVMAAEGGVALVTTDPYGDPSSYSFIDLDSFTTAPLPLPVDAGPGPVFPYGGSFEMNDDGTHVGFWEYGNYPPIHTWVGSIASLSARDTSARESDGVAHVAVRLARASAQGVRVNYASVPGSAGSGDYTPVLGTLVFPRGVTELTVDVPLAADGRAEGPETFELTLFAPKRAVMADDRAVVTIRDG
jgi:Tol biopolymer transport system component